MIAGKRPLAEKCRDFTKKNAKTIAGLTADKKLLKACYMCGYIYALHSHDEDCPNESGKFSDSMFLEDPELTRFSYSLFEFMKL